MIDAFKSGEVLATIGAGLVGVAYFFRNALTRYKREVTEGEKADAERQIVVQLREELDRLAAQNGVLAERLNGLQVASVDLHDEIVLLRRENVELRGEIAALRAENGGLHNEVVRLHDEIARLNNLGNSAFGGLDNAR